MRDTLNDILTADDPRPGLWRLVRTDDCARLFPELPALAMPDGNGRHKDVLAHSIAVTAKVPTRLPIRLAALLHDIGKPDTRRFDGGEVTFQGHEAHGANIARTRLTKLGYDRQLVEYVCTIIDMSGRFKDCDDGDGWSDSAVRRYVRDAGDALEDLLVFSQLDCTSKHRWKHDRQVRQIGWLRNRIAQVAEADRKAAERPDIDGRQLMDRFGLQPGPAVGKVLNVLLAAKRDAGRPLTEQEAWDLASETIAQLQTA